MPPILTPPPPPINPDSRATMGLPDSRAAVYHPATGRWFVWGSLGGGLLDGAPVQWGYAGAEPMTGDFDGDGLTDIAVRDRATGDWPVLFSSNDKRRVLPWNFGFLNIPGRSWLNPVDFYDMPENYNGGSSNYGSGAGCITFGGSIVGPPGSPQDYTGLWGGLY